MNLLIIGGTAYFGTDIVELALEAGHTLTRVRQLKEKMKKINGSRRRKPLK